MSFVCSDPCENGITREKVFAKCSCKSPFSVYLGTLGSKAMFWNFQYVKCLDKHVEQDDGIKSWVWEAEFQKIVQKNEHNCSVEGVFVVSDFTARLGKFKACLCSNRSESDQQKSRTRCWGSLAKVSSCHFSKFSWQYIEYNLLILTYNFPIQNAKLRLKAYLSLSPSGFQKDIQTSLIWPSDLKKD